MCHISQNFSFFSLIEFIHCKLSLLVTHENGVNVDLHLLLFNINTRSVSYCNE